MARAGEELARIRRIARRPAPGPAFTLSDESLWRRFQLRFIAIGLFFVLAMAALVLRKLQALGNIGGVVALAAAVVVMVAALAVFLWRHRKTPDIREDRDPEEDLQASEVQLQLQSGQLSPQDLVFEDRRWVTFLESLRFGEDALLRQGKLDRVQRLKLGGLIAAGMVVAVGLAGVVLHLGDIFEWLLLDK